jgi:hypothetical protein
MALSTSLWLTFGSIALLQFLTNSLKILTGRARLWYLAISLICVVLSFSRPLLRHAVIVLSVVGFMAAPFVLILTGFAAQVLGSGEYAAAFLVGMFILPFAVTFPSFFLTGLNRWSLRRAATVTNARGMAVLFLLNVGVLLALSWGLVEAVIQYGSWSIFNQAFNFVDLVGDLILETLVFPLLVMLSIATLILIGLGHRIFWPFVEKPIYSLARFGIFKRHALLATLGSSCILYAWPTNLTRPIC